MNLFLAKEEKSDAKARKWSSKVTAWKNSEISVAVPWNCSSKFIKGSESNIVYVAESQQKEHMYMILQIISFAN